MSGIVALRKFQKINSRCSLFDAVGGGEQGYQRRLVTTLMKHPKERSKPEIEFLHNLTKENLSKLGGVDSFFSKFLDKNGESSLKSLLRSCYYEYVFTN